MTDSEERVCVNCGASEETARLDQCIICRKPYCPDCSYKAGHGRRFCSAECARAYYFAGETDDDEVDELDD